MFWIPWKKQGNGLKVNLFQIAYIGCMKEKWYQIAYMLPDYDREKGNDLIKDEKYETESSQV